MVQMCLHLYLQDLADIHGGVDEVYREVEWTLKIFQTAAILEVLHCAIGLVPSSVVLTAFQVASRVFLTWGVAHSVTGVQSNLGITLFLFAWTITEIIRYSLYALSILGIVPYLLQWCRYTFFIVLYPIGVTGELMTIYYALPYVRKANLYTVTLPNFYNISFNYYYTLHVIMASYLFIFPQLYCHMLAQRRKIIGGKLKKKPE